METYLKTELVNGTPLLKFAGDKDKEKYDNFRMSCDEGQIVCAIMKKVSAKDYDIAKRNAHYFAYLMEVISNHDISVTGDTPSKKVGALHAELKTMSIKEHPDLLRVLKDKDGKDTYHLFSLTLLDTRLSLKSDEREKYYNFAFETLINLQKKISGWSIKPYRE